MGVVLQRKNLAGWRGFLITSNIRDGPVFVVLSAFNARLGDIYFQVISAQRKGVIHADGLIGVGLVRHVDKREALGLAAVTILDQFD